MPTKFLSVSFKNQYISCKINDMLLLETSVSEGLLRILQHYGSIFKTQSLKFVLFLHCKLPQEFISYLLLNIFWCISGVCFYKLLFFISIALARKKQYVFRNTKITAVSVLI